MRLLDRLLGKRKTEEISTEILPEVLALRETTQELREIGTQLTTTQIRLQQNIEQLRKMGEIYAKATT